MGIFFEQCEMVNRTSKVLSVRFDGQDINLEPNYDEVGDLLEGVQNMVPVVVVPYAKNQCVKMGSEDAMDPSAFESLVGVKVKRGQKQRDNITFCEQDDSELTRVPIRSITDDDPTVTGIKVKGQKAPRAVDAGISASTMPFDVVSRN